MFGIDDALIGAIAGPAIGSIIGGVSGSKSKTSNQTAMPNFLNPAAQGTLNTGNAQLLSDALNLYNKPFSPAPTTQAMTDTAFGGLFNNPELAQIQRMDNKSFFDKLTSPPAPSVAPAQTMGQQQPSNPLAGTMYQNWKNGQTPQPQITAGDPGLPQYMNDLAKAYSGGTPLPTTNNYIGGANSSAAALTPDVIAKLLKLASAGSAY